MADLSKPAHNAPYEKFLKIDSINPARSFETRISRSARIHPSAIISSFGVTIEDEVEVGPGCIVTGNATLRKGVRLLANVFVSGKTDVGEGTNIYPFASIGTAPQDYKYEGEPSELIIGKNNLIREHVTMNTGTSRDKMKTKVGEANLFMTGSHVGHDATIGNNCTIANNVAIAGHVKIDDFSIIGGNSAIQQFCRVGKYVMVGGMSGVESDIPPFALCFGNRVKIRGVNIVGLKRRGLMREEIRLILKAYNILFGGVGTMNLRIQELEAVYGEDANVRMILDFVSSGDARNICKMEKNIETNEI